MQLETRHVLIGIAVALAIGGGYAWHQGRQGEAPAQDRDPRATRAVPAAPDGPAPTLYKWQDDQGVWNYTDKPPADRPYEAISGTPNVNSVPSVVPEAAGEDPNAQPTP